MYDRDDDPGVSVAVHRAGAFFETARRLLITLLLRELFEFGDELHLPSESQICIHAVHDGRASKVFKPGDVMGEQLTLTIAERRSSPKLQRNVKRPGGVLRPLERQIAPAAGEQVRELIEVELAFSDPKLVPIRPRDQRPVHDIAPELRDAVLQDLRRARRRPVRPELFDQPIDRDRTVCLEQESDEKRTLLAASYGDGLSVAEHLQRAEDPILHRGERTTRHEQSRSVRDRSVTRDRPAGERPHNACGTALDLPMEGLRARQRTLDPMAGWSGHQ